MTLSRLVRAKPTGSDCTRLIRSAGDSVADGRALVARVARVAAAFPDAAVGLEGAAVAFGGVVLVSAVDLVVRPARAGFAVALPASPRLDCQTASAAASTWARVRPVMTLSGRSATMSRSSLAASSRRLNSSQFSALPL